MNRYPFEVYDDAYYRNIAASQERKIPSYRLRVKWLDEMLPVRPGERVVDLGSGAGTISRHLADRGAVVEAVDLSARAVSFARKRLRGCDRVRFRVGDATHCDHLASGGFDKCVCIDLIEHVHDEVMLGVFREAGRLLRPGGLLYVYSPNAAHWIERLKARGVILKPDPAHVRVRRIGEVVAALTSCGFRVDRRGRPASMLPGVSLLERLWMRLPLCPELAVYRVCVTARKEAGRARRSADGQRDEKAVADMERAV